MEESKKSNEAQADSIINELKFDVLIHIFKKLIILKLKKI